MAAPAVVTAVSARVAGGFTRCPVLGPNDSSDAPADGTPYLLIQFPVANVERWAVNQRYYREEGAVRLLLHTERGYGHTRPLQWMEELAALFRDQKFDGVESKTPSSPLINDDNEEGSYFRTAIVVPYTYNYTA